MPAQPEPRFHQPQFAAPVRSRAGSLRYAQLHCRTNLSFLEGASHPDELVQRAAELGHQALAITDRNSLAGIVRAHAAAKELSLKLLIGAEITPRDAPPLVLWASDRAAYANLCRLITTGRRRAPKGECDLCFDDIAAHAHGLLAGVLLRQCCPSPRSRTPFGNARPKTPFCEHGKTGSVAENDTQRSFECLRSQTEFGNEGNKRQQTVQPSAGDDSQLSTLNAQLHHYRDLFGDRCYGLAELALGSHDRLLLERMRQQASAAGIPLAAAGDVHYHVPRRRLLQDVLTAIRHRCTVAELGHHRFPNGERYLKSPAQMAALFAECPEAINRTAEIADRCTFSLEELRYDYPEELCPPGKTLIGHLGELTLKGAARRYPQGVPQKVSNLLEHELALIEKLRYESYFLTVWDLVRFARSRGILCQGRGSAANSAVCFCLGVTSVDPDQIDVLFERFVSEERDEAPDIDIDFEHERREEVIQYIYEKYGRERSGMAATVITYRPKSAVRDVGQALGLSLDRVDELSKAVGRLGELEQLPARCRDAGLDPTSPTGRLLVGLVGEILGFPRHLSQHVGGMVITHSPLCELVPIENAAMPGRTVIQWDKDDMDALGILKIDCLALGMLTALRKSFDLLRQHYVQSRHHAPRDERHDCPSFPNSVLRTAGAYEKDTQSRALQACVPKQSLGTRSPHSQPSTLNSQLSTHPLPLTLADIPAEDPAVYDMITRADTIGLFQVESRAQMAMHPRLKPRTFYDLVIAVAIVRPGPIQGDMVNPYLRRRENREPVEYPDERIKAVLEKTLGVPLFQEQAMKLAVVAAGFSPGEADQLRRAMGAWRKTGSMDRFRTKLIEGMAANGYSGAFGERLFQQIRGFGEYGFPESHAASFALLAYASAWLKCYYPEVFTTALLNAQPMGFYAPAQLVQDARQHDVEVRHLDVNFSEWDCTLESVNHSRGSEEGRPFAIRLGLRMIRGLAETEARRLVAVRPAEGFASFDDFARRTGFSSAILTRLSKANACSSLSVNRREATWLSLPSRESQPLFDGVETSKPPAHLPPPSEFEQVASDYTTTGLSLRDHPLSFVRKTLDQRGVTKAEDLAAYPHDKRITVAGLVLLRQRPGTARGVTFVTLEDETGFVNLIIYADVWERYRRVAGGAAVMLASGTLQHQNGVIHVLVTRLQDLSDLLRDVAVKSRDFR